MIQHLKTFGNFNYYIIMYISKETTTELKWNKIVTRDIRKIVVWIFEWNNVYCEIDCEQWCFDRSEFYISLDDISVFKSRWYPSRFHSYHSTNFDKFCLIEENKKNRNEYIKKNIKEEISTPESLLKNLE